LDVALYFLPYLPAETAMHRLKGRLKLLSKIEEGLKNLSEELQAKSSYHLRSIVEHNMELLQAEKKFIQDIAAELAKQKISIPEWPHLT